MYKHILTIALMLTATSSIAQEEERLNIIPKIYVAEFTAEKGISAADVSQIQANVISGMQNSGRCELVDENTIKMVLEQQQKSDVLSLETNEQFQYIVTGNVTSCTVQVVEEKTKSTQSKKYTCKITGTLTLNDLKSKEIIATIAINYEDSYTDYYSDGKYTKGKEYSTNTAKSDTFKKTKGAARLIVVENFPVESYVEDTNLTEKKEKITHFYTRIDKSLVTEDLVFEILVPTEIFDEIEYNGIGYAKIVKVGNNYSQLEIIAGQTKQKTRSQMYKKMDDYKKNKESDPNTAPIKIRSVGRYEISYF